MLDPDLTTPPKTLDEARTQIEQLWGIVGQMESLVTDLNARNEELAEQVRELNERMGKSSRNSSRPPSSDSTSQRAKRPKRPRSTKRQGRNRVMTSTNERCYPRTMSIR